MKWKIILSEGKEHSFRTNDVFWDLLNFEQNEMKEKTTLLLTVIIYQENRDDNLMKLTSYRKDQVWNELEKEFFQGDEFTLYDWGNHLHTKAVSFVDNMMMHDLYTITVNNK